MLFEQIETGGDRNFGYLIADPGSREAAFVDPGPDPSVALEEVEDRGLKLVYILCTHGHSDHAAGNRGLREQTGARVAAHALEPVPKDITLEDGATLDMGTVTVKVLHTPGHTPGSICFLSGGKLVTGDTLFVGKVGGTGPQFPGSDADIQFQSLRRLLTLPPETEVYPGHDYYGGPGRKPSSTIGEEARSNPFLLCSDVEEFRRLKDNWPAYKKAHGIR